MNCLLFAAYEQILALFLIEWVIAISKLVYDNPDCTVLASQEIQLYMVVYIILKGHKILQSHPPCRFLNVPKWFSFKKN